MDGKIQDEISRIRARAEENFLAGYNCSQAVVLAFADFVPMERDALLRLASSFGGGMGRLREVCGAVSAMAMVAGLLYGYDTPETGEVKRAHYERIQRLALAFEAQTGSLVCREMLGLSSRHDDPTPAARTPDYYKKRPCKATVGLAAEILAREIASSQEEAFKNTAERKNES